MSQKLLKKKWLMVAYLLNVDDCHTYLTQELPITLYELLEYPLDYPMMEEEIDYAHEFVLSQPQFAS